MASSRECVELVDVKPNKHIGTKGFIMKADPLEQDPQYGQSEWVGPEMKQAVAQERRRLSQHAGKTIRRPDFVARTMSA